MERYHLPMGKAKTVNSAGENREGAAISAWIRPLQENLAQKLKLMFSSADNKLWIRDPASRGAESKGSKGEKFQCSKRLRI